MSRETGTVPRSSSLGPSAPNAANACSPVEKLTESQAAADGMSGSEGFNETKNVRPGFPLALFC